MRLERRRFILRHAINQRSMAECLEKFLFRRKPIVFAKSVGKGEEEAVIRERADDVLEVVRRSGFGIFRVREIELRGFSCRRA